MGVKDPGLSSGCPNPCLPSVEAGLECLDTLTVSPPWRTGKTASRETEQNANAAVLWSSHQRGLPEQGCLGECQAAGKSPSLRAVRVPEMRRRWGAVLWHEGKQSLALFVNEGAGHGRQSTNSIINPQSSAHMGAAALVVLGLHRATLHGARQGRGTSGSKYNK